MAVTLPAPVDTRSRWQRLKGPTLLAAGLLTASVLLHVRDPHRGGSWGYCPWLVLTGTYCPGCGGLRAVNDLTDLRFADAASSNLLLVAVMPLFVAAWLRSLRQRWHGTLRPWPPERLHRLSVAVGVLLVGFWVLRNLPFAGWLTP